MKKAAIIGAGLGGLTFGALLAKDGWQVTVYDKKHFIILLCKDLGNISSECKSSSVVSPDIHNSITFFVGTYRICGGGDCGNIYI